MRKGCPIRFGKVFLEPIYFPFFSICSLLDVFVFAFIVLYISLLIEKLLVFTSIFVDGFKKNRKNRILEGFGKQSVKMKVGEFFWGANQVVKSSCFRRLINTLKILLVGHF